MAAIRALCIVIALIGFFLIGIPLQWLISRAAPCAAERVPIAFCRALLWLLNVRVTLEGFRTHKRPSLVVSNHISWIDILALGGILPFCFLAKSEIAGWPILSAFAQIQGTVFVDRKRRRSIPDANHQMATRLSEGRSVLLFPEGTTIAEAEPGAFGSSHFAAARDFLRKEETDTQIDVQPVAVAYSSAQAAWIGDDDLVSHVWRTLRAPPLQCVLSFGTPIPYRADSDRKLVAKTARASIVEMLAQSRLIAHQPSVDAGLDRAAAASV